MVCNWDGRSITRYRRCLTLSLGTAVAVLLLTQASLAFEPGLAPFSQKATGERVPMRPYAEGELARRMQQIKRDRLTAAQQGLAQGPTTMNLAIPVIMGNYSDNAHIFTPSDFQTLYFGANPTRSMTDYYDEVSYGQLHVTGTVYGPYTAAAGQQYYAECSWGMCGYPRNGAGFLASILEQADASIDFGQYDNDGPDGVPNSGDDDGYVDAIMAIFPDGFGRFDHDNMWAFAEEFTDYLSTPFFTNDQGADGIKIRINSFVLVPAEEGDGTINKIQPIGIPCHEFGHLLGLPDLYDSDGATPAIRENWGVGNWCLMGYGSTGATWDTSTAATPVQLSAWCKSYMGWLTPTLVMTAQTVEVPPVETTPTVYKVWEDGYQGGRYFLIENRTRTGFDKDLPGDGLLIWHCNEDACNENADQTFRLVDLEEADGLNFLDGPMQWGIGPTAGAMYPGPSNNTRFDDTTNPAATDVFGNATHLAVHDIAYVSGPGSPVRVTIKPRAIYGVTLELHKKSWTIWYPINGYGNLAAGTGHGAVRFTSPIEGSLVEVRPVAKGTQAVDFTVKVYDNIIGGILQGYHTSSSASFSTYRTSRYLPVPLAEPVSLTAGQTFVLEGSWGVDTYPVPVISMMPASGQSFYSESGVSFVPLTALDVAMKAVIRFPCIDSSGMDADVDAVADACDNCPATANADQADSDRDGAGDVCDNCPAISNPSQSTALGMTGDVNLSGTYTSSDVILLVNYTFKGGAAPLPCPANGDVNCSGGVTSADIITLVNHVFKGGQAPCNVCMAAGLSWSCP